MPYCTLRWVSDHFVGYHISVPHTHFQSTPPPLFEGVCIGQLLRPSSSSSQQGIERDNFGSQPAYETDLEVICEVVVVGSLLLRPRIEYAPRVSIWAPIFGANIQVSPTPAVMGHMFSHGPS
jgi:hypothetical protein